MPGVKRKSTATDEMPSKLAKLSSSEGAAKPTLLAKVTSGGTAGKTRELALSGSSTSGSSDLGSPTPPALRRASTLTVEEKEAAKAAESLSKTASAKKLSSASKPSLTKKVSSVVIESGTVTTVVPLKSGSSIGETALVSKDSLKKAESVKKSLSKSASVRSTGSAKSLSKTESIRVTGTGKDNDVDAEADEEKEEVMDTSVPLPPGGLLEIAISFDTTGSMYGVLEEVRAKVKDLIQRLQADIPGIRIAIIAHGDYCDADKYIVKWIDFGASLPELCDFVSNVERTSGGDGPECYELVLKRAREELAWTPGSQRVLVMIGDNEPHPVGYKYGGQTYYIDWKEECGLLREMGVKIYGVKANAWRGGFFKDAPEMTMGRAVELKNFTSIFDFLMMICYREANPDMMPIYESEVRARHKGGMAKDMEELVKRFGADPGSSATASTSLFGSPSPFTFGATTKPARATKAKPIKTIKKAIKPTKAAKPVKTSKPAKAAKHAKGKKVAKPVAKTPSKHSAMKKMTKKAIPKTSVKKLKGKSKKRIPKKKTLVKKKKLLREKLSDAKLLAGPLKKLDWSDWYLGVCHLIPKGFSYKKFKKSPVFGAYQRRNLFDNHTSSPAIYEIGVKKFGKWTTKKHVMYYRVSGGFSSKNLILYLLRTKKIRQEVERLITNKFEIHIRRGVVKKGKFLAEASKYLHDNFDYAWWRHGKKGHRKVVKNGLMLSDPAL